MTVKGKRMRQHKMQRKRKGNVREKTETKKTMQVVIVEKQA